MQDYVGSGVFLLPSAEVVRDYRRRYKRFPPAAGVLEKGPPKRNLKGEKNPERRFISFIGKPRSPPGNNMLFASAICRLWIDQALVR